MIVSTADSQITTLSESIALLIDLAERGEIDPWDVQVIEVIDRCLNALTLYDAQQGSDNASLSQSGQAFLYASMLVLLKAESLVISDEPVVEDADSPETTEELEAEGNGGGRQFCNLEKQLRRRAVAQLPRKRQVTLQELIEQLQLMKAAMESTPAPRRRTSARSRAQTARAIAELAHQENLVEMAGELERFLTEQWAVHGGDWLELEQLLELWPTRQSYTPAGLTSNNGNGSPHAVNPEDIEVTEVDPTHYSGGDRVGIFWALLLLSAQSKVELLQEEFYQDLKIRAL